MTNEHKPGDGCDTEEELGCGCVGIGQYLEACYRHSKYVSQALKDRENMTWRRAVQQVQAQILVCTQDGRYEGVFFLERLKERLETVSGGGY